MIFVFFVWLKKTFRSFGGVLLLTWVFAFWFFSWVFALRFLRGYLRFARFLNVNGRQWPLMVVNVFWLALLAMIVNVFLVDYAPMRVNGFATA